MTAVRLTLRQRLIAYSNVLQGDELEVLVIIAEGMIRGRAAYGALRLARDRRDFVRETLEECRDALVYIAAQLIKVRHAN